VLLGREVALRARVESDIPVLHSGLYEDVDGYSIADGRAWRPMAANDPASKFRVCEPSQEVAIFTVVGSDDGRLLGDAQLWKIDLHNRVAHIGLGLLPEARGRGLGEDVVEVLTRYAFRTLGLHRLQIETIAENSAMLKVAARAGFVVEGKLRGAGWVSGRFVDEVILGLLVQDWLERHPDFG